MRTTTTLARAFSTLLVATLMGACSESPSSPSGPSVDGVWVGTWGSTSIRFTLHQSGSSVTGRLQVGSRTSPLSGEVDEAGEFSWATELDEATCTTYSSPGLQLQGGGDALEGRMVSARRSLPCGSAVRIAGRVAALQVVAGRWLAASCVRPVVRR